MDFVVNLWCAAMVGILFLVTDLVGAPLPPALVGDIWINVDLLAMYFLARPA